MNTSSEQLVGWLGCLIDRFGRHSGISVFDSFLGEKGQWQGKYCPTVLLNRFLTITILLWACSLDKSLLSESLLLINCNKLWLLPIVIFPLPNSAVFYEKNNCMLQCIYLKVNSEPQFTFIDKKLSHLQKAFQCYWYLCHFLH